MLNGGMEYNQAYNLSIEDMPPSAEETDYQLVGDCFDYSLNYLEPLDTEGFHF